jgi:hypothetical protein
MSTPRIRITIGYLVAIVAVAAAGLIPLNNPTRTWLGALMYVKFGALTVATFLARHGRRGDFWFGFAACGWAYILFCVPGLWNAVGYLDDPAGIDPFDLTGTAGKLLSEWRNSEDPGPYGYSNPFAAVLSFWMTMLLTLVGGWVSALIGVRGGDKGRCGA